MREKEENMGSGRPWVVVISLFCPCLVNNYNNTIRIYLPTVVSSQLLPLDSAIMTDQTHMYSLRKYKGYIKNKSIRMFKSACEVMFCTMIQIPSSDRSYNRNSFLQSLIWIQKDDDSRKKWNNSIPNFSFYAIIWALGLALFKFDERQSGSSRGLTIWNLPFPISSPKSIFGPPRWLLQLEACIL
jgi:hypothetical protein